ncbi:polysaccharide deacetylase family protein, partial [Streptomyces sp. NPDC057674]
MPTGRRAVLRLAAALGATATVGFLAADRFAAPERAGGTAAPPAPPGRGAGPAAGPQAQSARLGPTAYRLQPMTAYAPPAYRRAVPPVRQRPFL